MLDKPMRASLVAEAHLSLDRRTMGLQRFFANSASRRAPGLSNVVQKQLTRRNSRIRRQVKDACGTSRAAIA